jgi:hypothetical protein
MPAITDVSSTTTASRWGAFGVTLSPSSPRRPSMQGRFPERCQSPYCRPVPRHSRATRVRLDAAAGATESPGVQQIQRRQARPRSYQLPARARVLRQVRQGWASLPADLHPGPSRTRRAVPVLRLLGPHQLQLTPRSVRSPSRVLITAHAAHESDHDSQQQQRVALSPPARY